MRALVRVFTPSGALRPWATMLVSVLGVALAIGFGIGYVRRVDQASDRRDLQRAREICGIIVLIDDRNQGMPPPADADTAAFRDELHRYRVSLGC